VSACTIPGCPNPSNARQLCTMHYGRWRRHGDPLAGGPPKDIRRGESEYLLGEIEWLFSFGIEPLNVARQLDRTLQSLEVMCRRHSRSDLASRFQKTIHTERRHAA
jgi:hypothetical protein